MPGPNESPIPYTLNFKDVLKREYRDVWARRPQGMHESAARNDAPPALYGVALSGGGIRSASFCLGALQALHQRGLAERIDYLSTVSGGGYTGASMISAMQQNGGRFPFAPGQASDMHDNEPVNNLRDYSRFLAPRGVQDLLISAAVILRGLLVNFILVLAFVLPLALIMILANPTQRHLSSSIVSDLANYWIPATHRDTSFYRAVSPYLSDQFLISKSMAAALLFLLLSWALRRSFEESRGRASASPVLEQASREAKWGRVLITSLGTAFFLELQPPILLWAMEAIEAQNAVKSDLTAHLTLTGMVGTLAAALVAMTATFQTTLIGWIKKALGSPTLGAWLKALLARSLIYLAGLILPIVIYGLFIMITIWGIRPSVCAPAASAPTLCANAAGGYAFTPEMLSVTSDPVLWATAFVVAAVLLATVAIRTLAQTRGDCVVATVVSVLGAVALFGMVKGISSAGIKDVQFTGVVGLCAVTVLIVRFFAPFLFPADLRQDWRSRMRAFFSRGWISTFVVFVGLAVLCLSAIAARNGVAPAAEWTVLMRYVATILLVWLVGWQFTENANGLHRLYRDRLSVAFRLSQAGNLPQLLSGLGAKNPYLLVNATLNARISDDEGDTNPASDPEAERRRDPAKRGRNADFFLFSRRFVGSASTGYAPTKDMESIDKELDLATAVAISGAAVSSSMGRIKIGLLGPTLALLNLRLGYWLTNPKLFDLTYAFSEDRRRSWSDRLRLYLFAEAFGQLRVNSSRVYVTDGGHIDNIGLYQLLNRRCKYIVVIDGEADPGMTFSAFSDLQRFARIDEGVRVTLNWMPIRDAALARMADRTKQVAPSEAAHDQHFAVGKILYEKDDGNTEEGTLIYVKASVTGDEPDYVLDYERRYPLFPHESTGDQFFSEEQMEPIAHSAITAFRGSSMPRKRIRLSMPSMK